MTNQPGMKEELEEVIGTLQSVKREWITKVPGIGGQINRMLGEFEFYRDSLDKPASVLVMGRTGAGKSSFINALLDNHQFLQVGHSAYSETKQVQVAEHITSNGTKLTFLDTRGVGEAGLSDKEALAQIVEAADVYRPRVAFILMPPDRSHWDEDLEFFANAIRSIEVGRMDEGLKIEIAGIITKVDTIVDPFDPKRFYDWRHPFTKSEEKISDWCNRLEQSLRNKLQNLDDKIDVFPVCAKFGYNDEDEEIDLRWGLDEVMTWLGNHAPFDLLLQISEFLHPVKRRDLAVDLVHRFSAMSAVVGVVPIPLADAPVIAYLQYILVRLIYALSHNKEAVSPKQYFALLGGATQVVGKAAARQAVAALTQLIPGWGTIVGGAANATVAAGFTEAFGRVTIAYYFDGVSVPETLNSLKEIAVTLGRRK